MKTELNFNGTTLPMITHDNDAWLTARDIANCLDYKDGRGVIKIYDRNKEELDEHSTVVKLTTVTGLKETRIFNEEGVMIITMLSKQPKAREFRSWAVKILKSYRHGQLEAPQPLALDQMIITKDEYIALLEARIQQLEGAKPRKRLAFTSKELRRIKELYSQGKTNGEIGRVLGRHHSSISNITKKFAH